MADLSSNRLPLKTKREHCLLPGQTCLLSTPNESSLGHGVFSSGDAIEFTGIWDEAKQTMTWNAPNPNDTGALRMVGVFDKSGSQVWTIFKDDSKGKVEPEIRGTHTPIK